MLIEFSKIVDGTLIAIKKSKILKLSLPGFDGKSMYEVFEFFFRSVIKGAVNMRAAAVSFKFFLALFPAMIFIFTLIPYLLQFVPFLPEQDYVQFIMDEIHIILPETVYQSIKDTVFDILSIKRQGLLSFAFLLTLFFATNGFMALMTAFNHSINVTTKRHPLKQRFFAILLMFITLFLVLLTTILAVVSELAFDYILSHDILHRGFMYYCIVFVDFLIIVALIYLAISFMYYFAPENRKHWKFFSAGSSLATLLCIMVTGAFSWYVANFGNYNKVYGSIGTLMIFMIWVNIISTILIVGFELNSSIQSASLVRENDKE